MNRPRPVKAFAVVSLYTFQNERGELLQELVEHHVTHSEADAEKVCREHVPPDGHYGPAWIDRDYTIYD